MKEKEDIYTHLEAKRTMRITAKCSDMFNAQLIEGGRVVGDYDGYVPGFFPNPLVQHYGDYVELEIDVATGKILNWKPPTEKQLVETFVDKIV